MKGVWCSQNTQFTSFLITSDVTRVFAGNVSAAGDKHVVQHSSGLCFFLIHIPNAIYQYRLAQRGNSRQNSWRWNGWCIKVPLEIHIYPSVTSNTGQAGHRGTDDAAGFKLNRKKSTQNNISERCSSKVNRWEEALTPSMKAPYFGGKNAAFLVFGHQMWNGSYHTVLSGSNAQICNRNEQWGVVDQSLHSKVYSSTSVHILFVRLSSQCGRSSSGPSLLCQFWWSCCSSSRPPDTPANWGGSMLI